MLSVAFLSIPLGSLHAGHLLYKIGSDVFLAEQPVEVPLGFTEQQRRDLPGWGKE